MGLWPLVGHVDQCGGRRRASTRRRLMFGGSTLAICAMMAAGMVSKAPFVLYPITPSLPPGLYIRCFEPPSVGTIAAFPIPEAAKRYKVLINEEVREEFLFMKPIVAGPGDHVCNRSKDGIYINGVHIAPVIVHDRAGRSLPQWRGCRKLSDDEIFALSTYVRNSFDSRHVGPINLSEVVGVYRRLPGRMLDDMQ